jgi:hypothetical protein
VRRVLIIASLVVALAATTVGAVFASSRVLGGDGDSAHVLRDAPLGVVPREGECVQIDYYNIGPIGRGPQSPLAAVSLIAPRERGLAQRAVAADRVVLERFEGDRRVAAYEAQRFDGFSPPGWMVVRSARSRPCDAAMQGDMPPEVPPIDRPAEPPAD